MTNSNNNGISVDLSTYVNALNEVLNATTKRFAIITIVICLVWGAVFSFFIYNAFYVSPDDTYYMEQEQPNQSQTFNKGVVTDEAVNVDNG